MSIWRKRLSMMLSIRRCDITHTLKQLHVNGGVSHRRWNVADYYCFAVAAATRTNVIIDGKTEEKIVILIHSTRNTVDYPNYYRDGWNGS